MMIRSKLFRITIICLIFLLISVNQAWSQSYRYWTRNFNDESSLLAGAVVGGGVGPSAIYFNPAGISEAKNSSFSLHASLISFNFYNLYNALGDGINLYDGQAQIQPRFISYLIDPKHKERFSIEFAFMNNEIYKQDFNLGVSQETDILKNLPGLERYFAYFQFYNTYRDDWVGIGGSWKINDRISLGISTFVSVKSLEYSISLDLEAYPQEDTILSGNVQIPFYSANYESSEYIKLNDYRVLWKLGFLYRHERLGFGISFKTPSIHVYADGKRAYHKEKQSNISDPDSDDFLADYVIVDYQEKKDIDINFKDPFSIAAGLTLISKDNRKGLYTTIEYFHGMDTYYFLDADADYNEIGGGGFNINQKLKWMSYAHGARPVLNGAIGYKWFVQDNLLVMGGIRTDFSSRKDIEMMEDPGYNVPKGVDLHVYHITAGVSVNVFGQDLIAGLQYSVGREINQKQFINVSDPVEFNQYENKPLQGNRENSLYVSYHGISFYLGATFNFGKKE